MRKAIKTRLCAKVGLIGLNVLKLKSVLDAYSPKIAPPSQASTCS